MLDREVPSGFLILPTIWCLVASTILFVQIFEVLESVLALRIVKILVHDYTGIMTILVIWQGQGQFLWFYLPESLYWFIKTIIKHLPLGHSTARLHGANNTTPHDLSHVVVFTRALKEYSTDLAVYCYNMVGLWTSSKLLKQNQRYGIFYSLHSSFSSKPGPLPTMHRFECVTLAASSFELL